MNITKLEALQLLSNSTYKNSLKIANSLKSIYARVMNK